MYDNLHEIILYGYLIVFHLLHVGSKIPTCFFVYNNFFEFLYVEKGNISIETILKL